MKQTAADSLRVRSIPAIGSIRLHSDSTSSLHSSRFVRTDAKNISDLLWMIPGFFPRSPGEFGKPIQLNAFGSDGRDITVLLDGRPMNDPISGTMLLDDLPLESIEEVEPLTGADALAFAHGGPSTVINLVTKQYNNTRPITKLRYMQGPFNYSLTDGLFSQNVARSTNLMLAFQRNVTDGRFTNSAYDSWQLRGRLRYNYSERFNIALSDFYSSAKNGMDGGVDQSGGSSSTDEVTAVVRNLDAYEKSSRHDLSLLGVGKFFRDSSSTTRFHAFYSNISREYNDASNDTLSSDISEHHHSSILGMDLFHHLQAKWLDATFGVSYEQLRVIESPALGHGTVSRSGFFGTATTVLFDLLRPTLSFREEKNGDVSALSFSVGIRFDLLSSLSLRAEFSSNHRFPTLFERSWNDSTVVRPALPGVVPFRPSTERHDNLEIGLDFSHGGNSRMTMSSFRRVVSDAIVFQPGQRAPVTVSISTVPSVTIRGLTGTISAYLWKLELVDSWMYTDEQYGSQATLLFPRWSSTGELAFRTVLFDGAMDLRVGGRWRFASQHSGVQFIPRSSVFVENPNNGPKEFSTLDLFLVAQIGEAYLTLSWENVANVNYFLVQNYPMPGRGLRLGVNWPFID